MQWIVSRARIIIYSRRFSVRQADAAESYTFATRTRQGTWWTMFVLFCKITERLRHYLAEVRNLHLQVALCRNWLLVIPGANIAKIREMPEMLYLLSSSIELTMS